MSKPTDTDGHLTWQVLRADPSQELSCRITLRNAPVIEPARVGLLVDGVDLGKGVKIGNAERYRINETYPWRGVHSTATNQCNGAKIAVEHAPSRTLTR